MVRKGAVFSSEYPEMEARLESVASRVFLPVPAAVKSFPEKAAGQKMTMPRLLAVAVLRMTGSSSAVFSRIVC